MLEGIADTYVALGEEISRVSLPKGREKLMRVTEKEAERAESLTMAEETLYYAVAGISALSQCYALKGEPEVASSRLRELVDRIREAGIQEAHRKALTIRMPEKHAPERVWRTYLEESPRLGERVEYLAPLAGSIEQPICFEVEFTEEELAV